MRHEGTVRTNGAAIGQGTMALDTAGMAELDRVEEKLRGGFHEVAAAIAEIAERELFKEAGYSNMAAYCQERLVYQKSQAYAYIAAHKVLQVLDDETQKLITNPSQLLPIAGMTDRVDKKTGKVIQTAAEKQKGVLQLAAAQAEQKNGRPRITKALVEQIAEAEYGWVPARKRKRKDNRTEAEKQAAELAKVVDGFINACKLIEEFPIAPEDMAKELGDHLGEDPRAWNGVAGAVEFLNRLLGVEE